MPFVLWSGKRDSNPRPPAWKAGALPLSYSRTSCLGWWGGEDLNPRRHPPADLQSAPFGHLGTSPRYRAIQGHELLSAWKIWSWREDLNPRPADYKSAALPLSYASDRQNSILVFEDSSVKRFFLRSFGSAA